jgi:beta-galactosidase/beta-glucuronidase
MQRSQWQNLNGIWQYRGASSLADAQNPPFGQSLEQEVLIPSCLESGLSGKILSLQQLVLRGPITHQTIGIQGNTTLYSWFSNSFKVPSDWRAQQILLNFGAVDYEATVFVNGKQAGFNRGGYSHFTVDVTQFAKPGQQNEL